VKAWDDYDDDLTAWRACYQRRTAEYFARQLERCESEYRLKMLVAEARETLEAWRRQPIPPGQPPEYGSPQWKRWIGESNKDAGELARLFGLTRQRIYQIRKGYRTVT